MSEEKLSYIAERKHNIMTVHGFHTLHPDPPIGKFDFIVKSNPTLQKYTFFLMSRCYDTAELSEPTARAFANFILKQCDRVKAGKGASK